MIAATSLLSVGAAGALAAAGDLDPSFNGSGRQSFPAAGADRSGANAMARQADGKLVVAGAAGVPAMPMVARLNADGTLDSTFGQSGSESFGTDGQAQGVAIDQDQKIVVASTYFLNGVGQNGFQVDRLNADGTPDSTFNSGSNDIQTVGDDDSADVGGVAVDAGNGILVAGCAVYADQDAPNGQQQRFFVARLNHDGSLDGTFGAKGIASVAIGPGGACAHAISILPDGRILLAGEAHEGTGFSSTRDFALARFTADGQLDTTFGNDGTTVTPFAGGTASATSLAVEPDGSVLAAGWASQTGGDTRFALAHYGADGTFDTSFGTVTTRVAPASEGSGIDDEAYAVGLQPGGRIVLIGTSWSESRPWEFAIARYLPDGTLDPSFGSGGVVLTPFNGNAEAFAGLIQPDGRPVAAGDVGVPHSDAGSRGSDVTDEVAVARYQADPPPAPTAPSSAASSSRPVRTTVTERSPSRARIAVLGVHATSCTAAATIRLRVRVHSISPVRTLTVWLDGRRIAHARGGRVSVRIRARRLSRRTRHRLTIVTLNAGGTTRRTVSFRRCAVRLPRFTG